LTEEIEQQVFQIATTKQTYGTVFTKGESILSALSSTVQGEDR